MGDGDLFKGTLAQNYKNKGEKTSKAKHSKGLELSVGPSHKDRTINFDIKKTNRLSDVNILKLDSKKSDNEESKKLSATNKSKTQAFW
mmetsp:Transcript_2014/g.1921  ORF Transcript_2014/g.1921 Transcript_2014/m.1921 type:complete len:88 (+) Transcript_2014:167-430(+)